MVLDSLGTSSFLSKFDLVKGFHQVPVRVQDRPKTGFVTPWGKYQYRCMPFGLRNAPAVFQRLMDIVLYDVFVYCRAYIDDVVVFSSSWEEHVLHLKCTLQVIQKAGLTLHPDKCDWGVACCRYLGYNVGHGFKSPDDSKITAIKDFSPPTSKTAIRSFLGLVGYYREFIPQFASYSTHLTEATRKSSPELVVWTDALQKEFSYLKSCLCVDPCLVLPLPSDSFTLQTDASGVGIGSVLTVTRNGSEHPVAYFSRKLTPAEQNYTVTELEGLAVVASIQHFEVYLYGTIFTVITDHRALTFLQSAKLLSGRLARWTLYLQTFNFKVAYRPGPQHQPPDALSRSFVDTPILGKGGGDVVQAYNMK